MNATWNKKYEERWRELLTVAHEPWAKLLIDLEIQDAFILALEEIKRLRNENQT